MTPPDRSTAFWLRTLRARRARIAQSEPPASDSPIEFSSAEEARAAGKFFNAAFRAEQSGLTKAHELAGLVRASDPELAEVLVLYGDEEGWHEELLTAFMPRIGARIEPMGRITGFLYRIYGRARRIDTIVLTNLLFETLGATTYRLTLPKMREPGIQKMLSILSRDESFHVPLNAHLLERLHSRSALGRLRLRLLASFLVSTLTLLPWASRPKTQAFDGLSARMLARAYAENMDRALRRVPGVGLGAPWILLVLLGAHAPFRSGRRPPSRPHLRVA